MVQLLEPLMTVQTKFLGNTSQIVNNACTEHSNQTAQNQHEPIASWLIPSHPSAYLWKLQHLRSVGVILSGHLGTDVCIPRAPRSCNVFTADETSRQIFVVGIFSIFTQHKRQPLVIWAPLKSRFLGGAANIAAATAMFHCCRIDGQLIIIEDMDEFLATPPNCYRFEAVLWAEAAAQICYQPRTKTELAYTCHQFNDTTWLDQGKVDDWNVIRHVGHQHHKVYWSRLCELHGTTDNNLAHWERARSTRGRDPSLRQDWSASAGQCFEQKARRTPRQLLARTVFFSYGRLGVMGGCVLAIALCHNQKMMDAIMLMRGFTPPHWVSVWRFSLSGPKCMSLVVKSLVVKMRSQCACAEHPLPDISKDCQIACWPGGPAWTAKRGGHCSLPIAFPSKGRSLWTDKFCLAQVLVTCMCWALSSRYPQGLRRSVVDLLALHEKKVPGQACYCSAPL